MASPAVDLHALAPEIVLTGGLVVILLVDLFFEDRKGWSISTLAGLALLAAMVPVLTLWVSDETRSMFGGAYVVDRFSLVLKGLFLVVSYLTVLLSVDHIEGGDYYRGEYYLLLLTSVLGMTVMASARDLITIFVALETLSIPTYLLAGWRKHDLRSNEAALKYYLVGVLSAAVMLYGMSLLFGLSGSTLLVDIAKVADTSKSQLLGVAIFLTLVGFAFKVSAVPFHFWAPDAYEGAPIPVTAFLSVASKTGGFVAMLNLVYVGFLAQAQAWQPIVWSLAAASMTVGNLVAIRQTNIVRMLAYSSIAQGGFMLVPFAVTGATPGAATSAFEATVVYLLVYAGMNLGAFAVVIAASRRTASGEIDSYAGLGRRSPGLAFAMVLFLFSLAGIPPLSGWFAKFVVFRAVVDAGSGPAIILGIVAGVNSVIALFYYARVGALIWSRPAPEATSAGSTAPVPVALGAAIVISTVAVLGVGVYPQVFARLGELATLAR
ncbi:MAG: NADH-quinone oxidoreductase subunit N [Acidimicrobiia bacterium]